MSLSILLKKALYESSNNLFIQIFRYFFVGGFAFVVDFGLLYILTEYAHFHYLVSATISFIAGLTVNYLISKIWVFQKSVFKNKYVEFFFFAIIGIIGLGLNNLLLWFVTSYLQMYYMVSKLIAATIVYFWNFLARRYFIFNSK